VVPWFVDTVCGSSEVYCCLFVVSVLVHPTHPRWMLKVYAVRLWLVCFFSCACGTNELDKT